MSKIFCGVYHYGFNDQSWSAGGGVEFPVRSWCRFEASPVYSVRRCRWISVNSCKCYLKPFSALWKLLPFFHFYFRSEIGHQEMKYIRSCLIPLSDSDLLCIFIHNESKMAATTTFGSGFDSTFRLLTCGTYSKVYFSVLSASNRALRSWMVQFSAFMTIFGFPILLTVRDIRNQKWNIPLPFTIRHSDYNLPTSFTSSVQNGGKRHTVPVLPHISTFAHGFLWESNLHHSICKLGWKVNFGPDKMP